MSLFRARGFGLAALALAGLVAASCGADDGDPAGSTAAPDATDAAGSTAGGEPTPVAVQELDIVGTEYAFDLGPPAELTPGWTTVSFHNEGVEAHQVMFARLRDGVDLAELAEVAGEDSSGAAAIEFVDMIGGVSYIGPGQSIDAMVDLPTGTVMAMCYVPSPDGVAHALRGMSTVLNVEGAETPATSVVSADDDAAGPPPDVAGTIELAADGYRFPESLPAGWYRVVNTDEGTGGEGLHELSILRLDRPLADGEVDEVVAELAANETPSVGLEALGGLGAISPGFEGYLHLDLPPGDYLAVDFMPDPGEARPHLLDGYYATFSP